MVNKNSHIQIQIPIAVGNKRQTEMDRDINSSKETKSDRDITTATLNKGRQ